VTVESTEQPAPSFAMMSNGRTKLGHSDSVREDQEEYDI